MKREQAEKAVDCLDDLVTQLRELETPCERGHQVVGAFNSRPVDECKAHDEVWPCTRLGLRRAMERAEAILEEVRR
jgi:hypothetical protein